MRVEFPKETLSSVFPNILQYYSSTLTTPSAFAGNPKKATREKGEIILVRCVERLELFLKQWMEQTSDMKSEE
jgi:creatinine amidohydrolase/Fe(II)-dependent formamide hydrolase-like protein